MKKLFIPVLLIIPFIVKSQHTFSIVAVDSITGEVGSAGATCGDSIVWPGTPGALIISDVIPNAGAIHTQSYYDSVNQINAHSKMDSGYSPQEIINWLVANDVISNPGIRQYGIVDYNGGNPRSAAYTGSKCLNEKGHILGVNYAIQGNTLLGQEILDSIEAGFNQPANCLADKLMAALQGANIIGADNRCTSEGTSSLSAFLRVAKPTDHPDTLFIDINIAGTATGVEPINELQARYDNWKLKNNFNCIDTFSTIYTMEEILYEVKFFPNPTNGIINFDFSDIEIEKMEIIDVFGKVVKTEKIWPFQFNQLNLANQNNGLYLIKFIMKNNRIITRKVVLTNN